MSYDPDKDRFDIWAKKGTKDKLKAKAKKQGTSMTALAAKALEKEASK